MTTYAAQSNLVRSLEAVRNPNAATLERLERETQKLLDLEAAASFDNEQAAELAAENAWLRAAEAPTNDDLAFADYESRMGLYCPV